MKNTEGLNHKVKKGFKVGILNYFKKDNLMTPKISVVFQFVAELLIENIRNIHFHLLSVESWEYSWINR